MQASVQTGRITHKQVKQHLRATHAGSLGDTERLANIHTPAERQALWCTHRNIFNGHTQAMIDTVMADCHRRIAAAGNAGRLSLYPRAGGAA